MSNSQKIAGLWWLPSDPNNQWFGRARWASEKSPQIELHYRTVEESAGPPPRPFESLIGCDDGGTPISLLRLGCAGGEGAGLLSTRSYVAGHLLKGVHVMSRDGFRAHRFSLGLQYLGDWIREEGFDDSERGEDVFAAKYTRPKDRIFEIAEGVRLEICHFSKLRMRARKRMIRYDIFFAMEKDRPFSWKQADRYVDALKSLLHFAKLERVRATCLRFENIEHASSVASKGHRDKIEVFNGSMSQPMTGYLHEDDFVFMFDQVEGRFAELCAKWFQFCVEQKEALNCYYPTVYFNLPDSLRLISLTQALEAYHQRLMRPKKNVKFKDRIKELCGIQSLRIGKLVGDIEQFATVVTDSRDFYTHHHPSIRQRGTVATGNKLTMLSYHLQFLFRICVLTQFGLEADRFNLLLRQIPQHVVEY